MPLLVSLVPVPIRRGSGVHTFAHQAGPIVVVEVLADDAEREALAALRKESHAATRDDATRCQLGREVSPNMLLKIVVEPAANGSTEALRLELFGIEQACMLGWSSAALGPGREDAAAAEAVSKLLAELTTTPTLPSR